MTDSMIGIRDALASRYVVDRELGRGGMSTVYLAQDLKHARRVALKVFRQEVADGFGSRRFLQEIQVAARLTHPHILPLHDSGESGGLLYYVMPYVEGESLRDRLNREQRLDLGVALRVGREVADALDYAHRHGVIHRDIKPENILLEDGHAVVTDFGVARAISAAAADRLTEAGSAVGTPMYMSPEQVAGEIELDGRSDIYSLGCVLFEALVGRPPFTGRTAQAIMVARLFDDPPSLRSIDPAIPITVDAVLAQSLTREPNQRHATAAAFSNALQVPMSDSGSSRVVSSPIVSGGQRAAETSVAVLPFVNLSPDPDNEYFSDGMTEELINALVKVPGLRVTSRTSSFAFKGKQEDARSIAERLRVRTLVEGSVRKVGNRLRITVQLINAGDGYHLWSETYERQLEDVFALQDEIARTVAGTLRPQLLGRDTPLVKPPTRAVEAYDLYLMGRYCFTKRNIESYQLAVRYFTEATEIDPSFAGAHAGLGHAYAMLGFDEFGAEAPRDAMPKARASVERALELDPACGEAYARRALITMIYDWEWERAGREFEEAMSLNPRDLPTLHWYSMYLSAMGRHLESLSLIREGISFEPLSDYLQIQLGRALTYAGRHEEAIRHLRSRADMEPDSINNAVTLARAYVGGGRSAEATTMLEERIARLGRVPILLAYLGLAYGRSEHDASSLSLLNELRAIAERRYVPVSYQALVALNRGSLDEGFRLLDLAFEDRSGWLAYMRTDPSWDPVRSDPRFAELLRRMRLDF